MKKTIYIDIPNKISSNKFYEGMHWSERKKIVDEFKWAVIAAVKTQKTEPVKEKEYPVSMTYIFNLHGRRLDINNCSMMAKMVEDGLVTNKIIKDDDLKYIKKVTYEAGKKRKKNSEVVVIIEPAK